MSDIEYYNNLERPEPFIRGNKIYSIPENTITINKFVKEYNFRLGAEIGVCKGFFTTYLCYSNPSLNMIAVDLWTNGHSAINSLPGETYEQNETNYQIALLNFNPYQNRIKVIRKYSIEAAEDIENESLDFCFIDATHTENALRLDILAWLPKIKENGLLCGHDYHPHWDRGKMKNFINSLSTKLNVDDFCCWFIWKKDIIKAP